MEDNILVATFKELKKQTSFLDKPYEEYDIAYLADNYILAKEKGDEYNKSIFMAALMLRYWHKIGKLYDSNKNLNLDKYEFYMWVYEAIEYACKYKVWQKKKSKVNANQAINQCINTIRLQHYYQYNLEKNKSNMAANVMSLNDKTNYDEDGEQEFLDTMEDISENPELVNQKLTMDHIVQNFIDSNRIVEGIIVDIMRNNDCEKIVKKASFVKDAETGKRKKVVKQVMEFWPFKVIKLLNSLPKDYKKQFESKYDVKDSILTIALESLKKANNSKKYKYLDMTRKTCKKLLARN